MIKKEITFIYNDLVEKQVFEMIAEKAQQRGYCITITNDRFAKCEIGWYCQHINFPQYSKFSIVMLHDLTQQYGYWPDIWYREPWNNYDIGFLPNKIWVENWINSSSNYYAHTRKGVFLAGWPKADRISEYIDEKKKNQYKNELGLDLDKPTVLYAPAWENDGKQDDFVQSVLPLDVNILVKQAPWPEKYKQQIENIAKMKELHKRIKRVIQLDPQTNILDAIMVSDLLVSEESSTMLEAVMMGKPAISVSNWLIPDVVPSRYPSDNYDFVVKTTKENLTETVKMVLSDYKTYQSYAQEYSDEHFANIGNSISIMMDVVDHFIDGTLCPYNAIQGNEIVNLGIKKQIGHSLIQFRRQFSQNYCTRIPILKQVYSAYKKVKTSLDDKSEKTRAE